MCEENKQYKPGQVALQNMKLLKKESTIFKVPKAPKKNIKTKKSKVLDEDVFVEGIAKIIQRDFFPDLEKLHAQNEFLEATENKDYARLRQITQKYSGKRPPTEPYNSPATFDTPDPGRPYSPSAPTVRQRRQDADHAAKAKPAIDITTDHTLDSFLGAHTSEDNASYERAIALEQRRRARARAAHAQLASEAESRELAAAALALPSIQQQAECTERPHELDTWRYTAKNYIMYVPEGAASQQPPPKTELVYQNTRLRAEPFDHAKSKQVINELAKTQDAIVTGKIGVDGVSIGSEKAGEGGEQAGYALVATPSPRPGAGADASPLMTWGHIEGTPFRLDGGDTPLPAGGAGAAYRMLESGARERIALQLAERVAKRRRPTTPRRPTTGAHYAFRTSTERLASMSPAARRLAVRHLRSPKLALTPAGAGAGMGGAAASAAGAVASAAVAASAHAPSPTPRRAGAALADDAHLTDNLLNINVAKRDRLKAMDFFK